MFDPVDPRQNFPALERGILRYWAEEDTFKRSIRSRSVLQGDPLDGPGGDSEENFSFYDGPPFATGLPHYGHLLAGTIKDVIPRYQTMQGKRVERRFGWDCHGLPIENLIEKEHDIRDKKQIDDMGVKAFNDLCRGAVQRYTKEWRNVVERMGRWVDMDWDYRTMDPEFMESIFWVFKSLHDKGLIYEGYKPMHVCPRCVTSLSNFEVTQGYKDVTDMSAYAKFEVTEGTDGIEGIEGKTYFLAWTTTPWTLPGNLFLAVNPKTKYVKVKAGDVTYIVAKERVEDVFKGIEHVVDDKAMTGKSLVDMQYTPLFPYFVGRYPKTFRVVAGDFVTTEDGTGIVHIAPGFGEDDFRIGKEQGIDPPLQHVSMEGKFISDVTDFAGMDVKPKDDATKTDQKVIAWLEKAGKIIRTAKYEHSYPHCWRCDTPLLNYVTSSWFVAVEKIKKDMLAANAQTRWVPEHIRDGRFGKWLDGARDWAISRSRYWGTPLPIWRNKETGDMEVIGSREDLMKRCQIRFTRLTVLRHGESDGNVTPRYQGKLPGTNLTKRGQSQAAATGEALKSEGVTRIYCSPLARTRQTAEAVAKATGAEIIEDERLREVEFGEYEGKSIDFSDLAFVKARRAHKLENNLVESIYHFPGMETWSQVQARIDGFLRDILTQHPGDHIVVVTHADPLLSLKHFFTKEEPQKLVHQPYPFFAEPITFFWDHRTNAALDLHKETVDGIVWPGKKHATSVEVTAVRHGQTDWNAKGLVQGEDDIPLNDTGRKQAAERAQALKGKKFDVVISSDLSRARETAQIIADALGLPLGEAWHELRERKLGTWSGKTVEEIHAMHPSRAKGNPAFHPGTPENGESLQHFIARVEKAYERLLREYPGKKVLLVAHRGTVQALLTISGNLTHSQAIDAAPSNGGDVTLMLHPPLRRIPEVLDCWFESGSMPYAQSHFPFSAASANDEKLAGAKNQKPKTKNQPTPHGFPADFIAEGIDQTRGWFYTLTVLGSALYKTSPFKNVIVNGTVLAEDGKKMSKRLKNYPEPLEIVEQHGADAVRFALMSSPAVRGEDLRFSAKLVEEQLRNVLLPLWNTYSFFVTYANAAEWKPTETRRKSSHPLDIWIRAEIQDLVNRMTQQLENYDLSATCAELAETIDALTNWYVRLSRRRFAGKTGMHAESGSKAVGSDNSQERDDAIATLYDVLLTFSQVLAPFCPFITDAMYLNLVEDEHGSVHLTDWPEEKKLTKVENALLHRQRLLRTIVSLGLKLRSDRKLKIRQPLAKTTIAIPASLLADGNLSPAERTLLQEELNVKQIELVDDPGSLATAYAQVDARKVGPRLGGRVQEIIAAGKRGEFTEGKDGSITILEEKLSADEVAVLYRGREGEDVAANHGIVVSLDTKVTPELELEGFARDLIRAIQQLRKDGGLELNDRITVSIDGADDILAAHQTLILQETGADLGKAAGEAQTVTVGKQSVTIRFSAQ